MGVETTALKNESFGGSVAELLAARSMSYIELARILGHKSKNTLFRILGNDAGAACMTSVCGQILACEKLKLSEKETEKLKRSLDISIIGYDGYTARQCMWNLLRHKPQSEDAVNIAYITAGERLSFSLSTFMNSLFGLHNEILMINCRYYSIAIMLSRLLGSNSQSRIAHYVQLTDSTADTVRTVDGLLPLIYNSFYSGYTTTSSDEIIGIMAYDMIVIRSKDGGGGAREYQIIINDDNTGLMISEKYHIYDYWLAQLSRYESVFKPLKSSFPNTIDAESYVEYTRHYGKLEYNHNIYTYHPDICLDYINENISRAALIDGIKEKGIVMSGVDEYIDELTSIQSDRFLNMMTKKKATQAVCVAKDIENFARTGLQNDHFFAMRAYTVKERIDIFSNLLNQLSDNPFFNIYLLKDENEYISMEATCFETVGVQFTSAYADYNLACGHTESLITNEEFTRLFITFFMDEMVKKHCSPVKDTIELFNQIVADLRELI